ncbi:3-hydroxyacyl-ACP dehydratase FabZ family protein [Streptomyces xiangluensis]|uniref:3-hydroxyacyl-ACP dehydratase FabZ family protein n=1 Tax=Streptomyces xiangluensis TaxID=2665720 RepID=A0ABV8YTE1_9ACTN
MSGHERCRSVRTPYTVVRADGAARTCAVELPLDPAEPVFNGHYRGFPIFAGVFLVETAHLAALGRPPAGAPRLRLTGLESSRFLHPAYPGDTLTFSLRWTQEAAGWVCRVTATTERDAVARIRLRYEDAGAVSPLALPEFSGPLELPTGLGPLSLPELMARIPHRDEMLLIDRVLSFTPGEQVTAEKAVTYGEPWYRHLDAEVKDPAAYAYPIGPLMESFNQAAAVLATADKANTDVLAEEVLMLGSYTRLAFGPPVFPGDTLEHSVRLARTIDDIQIFEGTTRVRGELVLTVNQAVLARRPADRLRQA